MYRLTVAAALSALAMGQDDVDLSSQNGYLDANVGIGADSKWSRAGTSTLTQGNRKNLGFTEKPNSKMNGTIPADGLGGTCLH